VYWCPSIDLLTSLQFFFFFIVFFVVVADLRYLLIPDFFVVLASILALGIISLSGRNWLETLGSVGVAVGFFVTLYYLAERSLGKEALGWGDIKLMVPLGLLLPWPLIVVQIFLAFISGGIFATLVVLLRLKKFGQSLPFAPFLIVSFIATYFFGETMWQWYTGLMF
jgi:prepilin signal peptidase PulO-like enzyme (type II secretory pathway)